MCAKSSNFAAEIYMQNVSLILQAFEPISLSEMESVKLMNQSAVFSGAAVHIQNGKRVKVKPLNGTTNTLVDAANGKQKGCLYIKGHAEFAQKGTLNVTGNTKHAIKTGEYISLKNATINILGSASDGINCEQFFLMESGAVNITNIADDGIQCDIGNTETGSTGETTEHENEDSGNMYITGGTCKQASSWTANTWHALYNNGELVLAFKTPSSSSSSGGGGRPGGSSSKKLVVYTSSTPTLKSGVTASGTEVFDGVGYYPATATGGSNVTLSNYSSSGGGWGW